jgi:hypothetical protein
METQPPPCSARSDICRKSVGMKRDDLKPVVRAIARAPSSIFTPASCGLQGGGWFDLSIRMTLCPDFAAEGANAWGYARFRGRRHSLNDIRFRGVSAHLPAASSAAPRTPWDRRADLRWPSGSCCPMHRKAAAGR